MLNILFVDDEQNILNGYRRMLHSMRKEWELDFVSSGQEAIEIIQEKEIDILVTDMKMPVMNGAELLKKVKEIDARIIRIILSGQTDDKMALEAAHLAHQFLIKPCSSELLINHLLRLKNLTKYARNPAINKIIGMTDKLPTLPRIYRELQAALSMEEVSFKNIVEIVKSSPAVAAKILHLSNSAFFGVNKRISDIQQAINLLGINGLQSFILFIDFYDNASMEGDKKKFIDNIYYDSLNLSNECEAVAVELKASARLREDARITGLLFNIGKLFMIHLPNYLSEVKSKMEENSISWLEAEHQLYNTDFLEVGAYLLGIWNLPFTIVDAIAQFGKTDIQEDQISVLSILSAGHEKLKSLNVI